MNRRQFLAAAGIFAFQRRLNSVRFDEAGNSTPLGTVRQPYVQNVRKDRASILWASESRNTAFVQYSSDGVNFKYIAARARTFMPAETGLATPFTQYTAVLPKLSANTTYIYNPYENGDMVGGGGSFRTAVQGSDTFRFLVLGDSGMGTSGQARIAKQLSAETASFLLHVGDIAYGNGSYAQFQQNYFNYYQDIMARIPFFTTPGNHEYGSVNASPYLNVHSLPSETVPGSDLGRYYSFDWGNAHFVSIDSNDGAYGGSLDAAIKGNCAMLDWLDRDLRSTRQFWRIVFFHHPPYAGGANFGDPNEPATRTHIVPILEANGVQLVLNGHEHNYQRTASVSGGNIVPDGSGTVYLTAGGGGADLYDCFVLNQTAFQKKTFHFVRVDVSGGLLTVSAIDDTGVQFDAARIMPSPVLASAAVTFDGPPTAGSMIHIHGWNLALQETFPKTIGPTVAGTSLLINNTPVPLIYVSPTQVVGLLPFDLQRAATYILTTANGSVSNSISL